MAASSTNAVKQAPKSLHVGLDIGTYASGFAFSERAAPVRCHESWPDQPKPYPKTRSVILYKARTPLAFGWSALKELAKVPQHEQKSYSLIDASVFKLGLHDPSRADKLPPGLTAIQVMADFLSFMRKYTLTQLGKELGAASARVDNIQWCMTVPAMWGDASKHAMREAALRAGFIHKIDSDALSVILEPEAAAIYALDNKAPPLLPGETVMIIDAGGGTVDTTVHACQSKGGLVVLAEAVHAAGALSGSAMVDEEFKKAYRAEVGAKAYDLTYTHRKAYRAEVGAKAYDLWVTNHPAELSQVMQRFEAIKCLYRGNGSGNSSKGLNAFCQSPLPSSSLLGHGCTMRMFIPPGLIALQHASNSHAQRGDEVLLQLKHMFEGPVQQTIQLALQQLGKLGQICDKVLLVGGFASSPYLQMRVRSALLDTGKASTLVVPPCPYASVLTGAVLAGIRPELIHARRSKLSYGVGINLPYQPGFPGMFTHRETGELMTDKGFLLFVSKDEMVELDSTIQHTVHPLYSNSFCVSIRLYASDCPGGSIKYIDDADPDMRKTSAVVEVQIPPSYKNARDASIRVQMLFGRTELVVRAWEAKGGQPVQASIKFAHA